MSANPASRWGLRFLGLGYLTMLLLIPLVMIFYKTFEEGIGPPLDAITSPDGLHALKLSVLMVAIFRRIIFPNLLPGLGAGIALAFARALGEFGSVLLFAGGLPDTTVTSVFIRNQVESDNLVGASAVSMVLLFASLLLLGCVSLIQRWAIRHDRSSSEFIPTLAKDVGGGGNG